MAPDKERAKVWIGCAGWSLPRSFQDRFPTDGTHLQRYAARFPAVEINSSFYRSHRTATYERWRDSVPPGFRFSVKVPKAVTHALRLREAGDLLRAFTGEVAGLGDALGCLLVQLPPSLAFVPEVAGEFFGVLAGLTEVPAVCEPRHPSWFTVEAEALLARFGVGRVAADPVIVPAAARPGAVGIAYYRHHGSPRMYYSAYVQDHLATLGTELRDFAEAGREVWCIFDNTAAGEATGNALTLLQLLGTPP